MNFPINGLISFYRTDLTSHMSFYIKSLVILWLLELKYYTGEEMRAYDQMILGSPISPKMEYIGKIGCSSFIRHLSDYYILY